MSRRRALWVLGAVVVLLGVGAIALRPWLKTRVEDELSRRLGLPCRVASVHLGLSRVVVDGISFGGVEQGLRGEVGSVVLTPGPLSLAFGGGRAITSAHVTDAALDAELDSSPFRTWFERIRARRRHRSESAAAAHGRPAIRVTGARVALRDQGGALAQLQIADAMLESDGALMLTGSLGVGESSAGELSLDQVSVHATLGRGADGARIDVGTGYVVAPPADDSAVGARTLERCLAIARALAVSAQPATDVPPVQDAGTPGTVHAAEAAQHDAPAPPEAAVGASEAGEPAPFGALSRAWSTLARARTLLTGAQISLDRFELRVHKAGADRVVVRELSARFGFTAAGLRLDGRGVADTGGRLSWDLRLDPLQARGEGSVAASELPLDLLAPILPSIPLTHAERGRLSLNLELRSIAEEVAIEGELNVLNAELTSPKVAAHPVGGLALAASGRAQWNPAAHRLTLDEVRLTEGQASVTLTGSLEATPDHYAATLRGTLPPTACADALGAIPRDLLDDVADFSLDGRIAARVDLRLDSRDLEHTELGVQVADGCRFVSVPAIADLRRVAGPFVHTVVEPDGSVFEMTTGPGTPAWTPIGSISPFLVHAIVSHEDAAFFRHAGFAPWAIRDALVRDLRAGRFLVGASTISMQLAKNLFLRREKTLARKAQEVILTWWLEAARTKQEILELYLNLIEYGPSIYGIRAAANHYFGGEPAELSAAEAAFLATSLPDPKRFHAMYVSGELTHSTAARMRHLLEHMAERGRIDELALADGLAEIDDFHFAQPGVTLGHRASGGAAALGWSTDGDETTDTEAGADEADYPEDGDADDGSVP